MVGEFWGAAAQVAATYLEQDPNSAPGSDGEFWGAVGVVGVIATAVATGVSTMAALWWRRQDRSEADWAWLPGSSSLRDGRLPRANTTISNAGDGVAFRMHVKGEHCDAWLWRWVEPAPASRVVGARQERVEFLPAVPPGEDIRLGVECDLEEWDRANVVVEWTRSPTWKKKTRTLTVPLHRIAEKPEPPEDQTRIPSSTTGP